MIRYSRYYSYTLTMAGRMEIIVLSGAHLCSTRMKVKGESDCMREKRRRRINIARRRERPAFEAHSARVTDHFRAESAHCRTQWLPLALATHTRPTRLIFKVSATTNMKMYSRYTTESI